MLPYMRCGLKSMAFDIYYLLYYFPGGISGRELTPPSLPTCEAGTGPVEVVGEGAVEVVELAVLGGHPRGKLARLVVVAN